MGTFAAVAIQRIRTIGRPKDGDSSETRLRLLAVAQTAFAQRGYDATTNKEIASAAGITPGAIYHYFPSKTDLYVAVFEAVLERVFGAFERAIAGHQSLIGQFSAVLDCTVELTRDEPTLTGFVVGVFSEVHIHPELSGRLLAGAEISERFYRGMVTRAVERGELSEAMARPVEDLLTAVLTGLARFGQQTNDAARHAGAFEALKQFLAGTLVR
jgi:AcrR family transcriptional regulator